MQNEAKNWAHFVDEFCRLDTRDALFIWHNQSVVYTPRESKVGVLSKSAL